MPPPPDAPPSPAKGWRQYLSAVSVAAVVSGGFGIMAVKVVEELTGYATNAAIGAFMGTSRVVDLGPDSDAFTVLSERTVFQGDTTKTDLDLFRCQGAGPQTRTLAVLRPLETSGQFGRIRLRVIDPADRARPLFDGLTTVVYDADHGERNLIPTVWDLLPDHEAVQLLPNSASRTGWLLSVFIC